MIVKHDVLEFLRESNNIEGIWDDDSLIQAVYAWDYLIMQKELNPHVILKTHKILMLHQPLMPNERGYFRRVPVWIGGREAGNYKTISESIDNWCKDAMTSIELPGKAGKHIRIDHVEYELIHPFVDGNGRTGRMFMNWQRVKAGLPILVIKESEKQEYYKWFR